MNDKELLLKVFDCLIDTAKTATDLDNVYSRVEDSEGNLPSVSWAEVFEARKSLGLANLNSE
jgi:hypothetical protein